MSAKIERQFMCDFETTVYKGQIYTEVWASAIVEFGTEDVFIHSSIDETFNWMIEQKCNMICYYHNLKFDGHFWLDYLISQKRYKQAYRLVDGSDTIVEWLSNKDMPSGSFKYSISDMGQWYTITIKTHHKIIEIRDSLKLLPFSVKRIGESFGTKHKKLEMEYEGFRYAGCYISDKEKEYIANDVLVVKEALEIMFSQGHTKTTIGSNCLEEFKKTQDRIEYNKFFPDLYKMEIDSNTYGSATAGEYIQKSYKGGWCYLVKGKENKKFTSGCTADVNSLYPSMMSSESGNKYPIGKPLFWKGNYIEDRALHKTKFYFIRIKTRFYLKEGYLPCIQIKRNPLYKSTEWLETSDIYDPNTGKYLKDIKFKNGSVMSTRVVLTLTMMDYELIKTHYELVDFEILDGCYFTSIVGIFDEYIEKYKQIKLTSTGAQRELAKLFLNNLYGKMASNTDSSFKLAYIDEDKKLCFRAISENKKKPGYIPIGSAITSYARNFTIKAAQLNYHGKDKRGFIYADTDSIHCDLSPEELRGITVHDKNFCCWKLESSWDTGWYARQKTYIEHITQENLKPVSPHYDVKCAGMPSACKDLFIHSMNGTCPLKNPGEEAIKFLEKKRTIEDFTLGLKVPGKLIPKRIQGGIVLMETTYEMR